MNRKVSIQIQEAWDLLEKRVGGGEEGNPIPEIRLGTATCGRASGALESLAAFREEISRKSLPARLLEVGCIGHCYAEPIAVVKNPGFPPILYGSVTPGVARRLVRDFLGAGDPCLEFALGALEENENIPSVFEIPRFRMEKKIILEHAGWIDPARGEEYLLRGGYRGLFRALGMDPREVIRAVKAAGLRGLGGAGFPAGLILKRTKPWRNYHRIGRRSPPNGRRLMTSTASGSAFSARVCGSSDWRPRKKRRRNSNQLFRAIAPITLTSSSQGFFSSGKEEKSPIPSVQLLRSAPLALSFSDFLGISLTKNWLCFTRGRW